jgi:hypothetical protein
MSQTVATSFPIEELARAVAAQIAAVHGKEVPVVTTQGPTPPLDAPGPTDTSIGGEVTIEIQYSTTLYALRFNPPTTSFNAWLFRVTMQELGSPPSPAETIVLFELVDKTNWKVTVQTPGVININDTLKINKFEISIFDGTVPDPPK